MARVPAGVGLDLGGIAKGHAADLVLTEVLAAGAAGGCVNVGGDLAVAGQPPTDDGWIVGVDDPFRPGREVLRLALAGGAVATTSRLRRRWRRGGVEVHHVLDPRTGRPATTRTVAVTVIAGRAADAEVLAKLPFLDLELAESLLHEYEASAVVIDDARGVRCLGAVERFAA
jgi:thiamine biosynthesis lipoprotein